MLLRLIATCLLGLLVAGCGGGSSAPDPDPDPDPDPIPTMLSVVDVFPKNLGARSGSSIRFIAELSQQASSYLWNFGGGAEPNTSTLTQPLVVLGAPGTYTATLTVCAADCATPFEFHYTVAPNDSPFPFPRVLGILPAGEAGARGDLAVFTATIDGEADLFSWDFGEGTRVRESTERSPEVLLLNVGTWTGHLTVALSGGSASTFDFEYTITPGVLKEPPVIGAIAPEHLWSCDNKHLVFEADVASDVPIDYHWELTGGVTPLITTNSVARMTSLGVPSNSTGTLIASNEFGSDTGHFELIVNNCPDATAEPVSKPSYPRGSVFLRPGANTAHLGWDIRIDPPGKILAFNNGILELGQATNAPLTGTIGAQAFDGGGVGDTYPLAEPITHPTPVPQWSKVFEQEAEVSTHHAAALALKGDRPILVYRSGVNAQLQYAEALVANPTQGADWVVTSVDHISRSTSIRLAMTCIADRTTILLLLDDRLHLYDAVVNPQSLPPDWNKLVVTGLPQYTNDLHLQAHPDGRFLAMVSRPWGERAQVIQTRTAHPVSAADLSFAYPFDLTLWAYAGAVQVWQGRWQIALHDRTTETVVVATATEEFPIGWPDWQLASIDTGPIAASDQLSLAASDTRTWLFQNTYIEEEEALGMHVYSATAPIPMTPADWADHGLLSTIHGPLAGSAIDGRLALVPQSIGVPVLVRALSEDPLSGRDWHKLPLPIEGSDAVPDVTLDCLTAGQTTYVLVRHTEVFDQLRLYQTAMPW